MEELELHEKQEISNQNSLNALADQLILADHLVYKKYLAELQNYGMVTLSQEMLNVQNAADCIRMYQLKELTLKKGEDMFQKLSTVYYSSMAQGVQLGCDGRCAGRGQRRKYLSWHPGRSGQKEYGKP